MRHLGCRSRQLIVALLVALATATTLVSRCLGGTVTRPSPEVLREHLRAILSSRAYQVNPPLGWQLQRWLLEQLERVLRWLHGLSEAGPFAGLPQYLWWVIVGICVLALVLLLYHMAITLRGLLEGPTRRAKEGERPAPRRGSPEQALRAARDAAARGEFKLALHHLYQAALLRLDQRGALRYAPARTNWENLWGLKSARLRTAMEPLTRAVDDVFYGGRRATAEIYGDCRKRVRAVWDAEVGGSE